MFVLVFRLRRNLSGDTLDSATGRSSPTVTKHFKVSLIQHHH